MNTLTKGFNEVESVIAKTMEYLSVPSVVGHENFFLKHLRQDFESMGLQTIKHPRLLEIRGNDPHGAIICAHIDRHGLISIGNNEYVYAAQFMKEIEYGEDMQASRRQLEEIAKRFEGEKVFAYDPKTNEKMGEGFIQTCRPCMTDGDSLFFVEGMDAMPQGIPIAYARTAKVERDYLKGQIDNAASLGIVHALFKSGFQGTALLTTEEEIGKSWMHIAEYLEGDNIYTQDLLVLDTSPYNDHGPIDNGTLVLRNRDKTEMFNAILVKKLKERCSDMNLPFEVKDEVLLEAGKKTSQLGSTELGRLIQGLDGRWSGATIQIPTVAYHTSNETTTNEAIKNYFRFLQEILIKNPVELDIKAGDTN